MSKFKKKKKTFKDFGRVETGDYHPGPLSEVKESGKNPIEEPLHHWAKEKVHRFNLSRHHQEDKTIGNIGNILLDQISTGYSKEVF